MGKTMSKETYFELLNNTNRDITSTTISGVEDHEWIGEFRPNKNLAGRRVSANGGSIREREELCGKASHCPFTMTLEFSNGTRDVFRVHQMYAVSDCCDEVFHHVEQSHDIDYKRVGDKTLLVTVENTQDQLVNIRAEEVNKRGEDAMRKNMHELARKKFIAAKRLANETSTINMIEGNLKRAENARGEEINREGKEAMERKSYKEAMEKFDEALTLANETSIRNIIMENQNALRTVLYRQKQNERAIVENGEGEEAFRKGKYETAIQKFRQAYLLSNEMSTINLIKVNLNKATNVYKAQQKNEEGSQLLKEKKYKEAIDKFDEALKLARGHSLLSNISNNKVQAVKQYGKVLYDEAWRFEIYENENMSKKAEESFRKARFLFKMANSGDYLRFVELKIAGNTLFNESFSLEQEALKLYNEATNTNMVDDYEIAQRKYEEALKKYEDAKKKFEEGASNDEMFSENVKYVKKQIEAVQKQVEKIEAKKLNGHIRKVMFEKKKGAREDDAVVVTEGNLNFVSDAT